MVYFYLKLLSDLTHSRLISLSSSLYFYLLFGGALIVLIFGTTSV